MHGNAHPGSQHQNERIETLTMGETETSPAKQLLGSGKETGAGCFVFCIISALPSQRVAVTVSHMTQGK